MNGLDKLDKVGSEIKCRLIDIRESIGANLGYFAVNPIINIKTGAELKELAEGREGEPIIIGNEFYLAYIRDNATVSDGIGGVRDGTKSDYDIKVKAEPSGCYTDGRKVHFYYCETIRDMTQRGQDSNYACTSYFSNIQPIDLQDAENIEARLALCQNCIKVLAQNSGIYCLKRKIIAEYGNAQRLMDCVKLLHKKDDDARQKTEEFINRTMRKAKV